MSYERDFTIGYRETRDFHLSVTLRRWWKGMLGFALVAVLVVWMYMFRLAPDSPPLAVGIVAVVFAVLTFVLGMLTFVVTTILQVRSRVSRTSYVQATKIDGFGVHVTVGKKKAKLPFDRLLLVRETKKAFYLFIAEDQAWLLPKAQMADPVRESDQLRQIFRTVVERRKLELQK